MTVDILMATHNGGKHLRAQLDSIVHQTHKDWRLLVRDDGSNDDTLSIIKEYIGTYGSKKIVLLPNDDADSRKLPPANTTVKVIRNFSGLMERSKADGVAQHIMFSDQDDCWYPDKIAGTLVKMQELEKRHGAELPLLVHTDARLISEKGAERYPSFKHSRRLRPERMTFRNELVQCAAQGCTIMMNHKLLDIATPIPDTARMHDMWVALIASGAGHQAYLSEPTMDYRQHDTNVLGGYHNRSFAVVSDRMHTVLGMFTDQAKAIAERIGGIMHPKQREELERFLEISQYRQPLRGAMMVNEGFVRTPLEQNLAMFAGKWFGSSNGSDGTGSGRGH